MGTGLALRIKPAAHLPCKGQNLWVDFQRQRAHMCPEKEKRESLADFQDSIVDAIVLEVCPPPPNFGLTG